jgi:hypothetical protein
LADLRYDRLRFPFLAKIRHQQKHPRQTLLARIKKLIDQVFLDAGFPRQQERYERLGKFRLVAEHAHDGRFVEPHNDAFHHRLGRRQAQRVAVEAAFAKKVPLVVQSNDRFLPRLVYDAGLDPAFLNVKDRIRPVALRLDFLLGLIRRYGPSLVNGAEEGLHVERNFLPCLGHDTPPLSSFGGKLVIYCQRPPISTFSLER